MIFFHGTNLRLDVGFELKPQADGYAKDSSEHISALEDFIELGRPHDKIPRRNAVYLSDDPDLIDAAGGLTDAIYEIKPIGFPEKSDLAWYTQTQFFLDEGNELDAAICAQNYWSGLEYVDENESCFEYRVIGAHISSVFEINVDDCDLVELPQHKDNPHQHHVTFTG